MSSDVRREMGDVGCNMVGQMQWRYPFIFIETNKWNPSKFDGEEWGFKGGRCDLKVNFALVSIIFFGRVLCV